MSLFLRAKPLLEFINATSCTIEIPHQAKDDNDECANHSLQGKAKHSPSVPLTLGAMKLNVRARGRKPVVNRRPQDNI